jgi:hypothetical protein
VIPKLVGKPYPMLNLASCDEKHWSGITIQGPKRPKIPEGKAVAIRVSMGYPYHGRQRGKPVLRPYFSELSATSIEQGIAT